MRDWLEVAKEQAAERLASGAKSCRETAEKLSASGQSHKAVFHLAMAEAVDDALARVRQTSEQDVDMNGCLQSLVEMGKRAAAGRAQTAEMRKRGYAHFAAEGGYMGMVKAYKTVADARKKARPAS